MSDSYDPRVGGPGLDTPPPSYPGSAYPGAPSGAPPLIHGAYPMAPTPQPRRKRRGWILLSVALAVVVVVGLAAGAALYARSGQPLPFGQAAPKPTATPTWPIAFQDSLTVNTNGWTDEAGHCFFKFDGYHVVGGNTCFAPVAPLGAETVTVTTTLANTSDSANYNEGILLWQQLTPKNNCYAFLIEPDGKWGVAKTVNDQDTWLVNFKPNAAIKRGVGATNVLEARATPGRIEFFVNGTRVGEIHDTTFSQGLTGLYGKSNGEAVFTDMAIHAPGGTPSFEPFGANAFHDSLTSDLGNLPPGANAFGGSGYHMTDSSIAPYGYNDLADVNLAVTAIALNGSSTSAWGLAFRHTYGENGYLFLISAKGNVAFAKVVHGRGSLVKEFDPPVVLRLGYGSINTLEVHAKGSHFEFFINGANVGSADDSSIQQGQPGLVDLGADVYFSDFWKA